MIDRNKSNKIGAINSAINQEAGGNKSSYEQQIEAGLVKQAEDGGGVPSPHHGSLSGGNGQTTTQLS